MKKYTKIFTTAIIAMLICSSFAGCTSGKKQVSGSGNGETYSENGLSKNTKVELKVGYMEAGAGREYYDYAVKTFTKKFPNVTFNTTYSPKITTIIDTKAQAGNDNDMFDLFMGTGQYAQAGKLEPLDDIYEKTLYDKPNQKIKDSLMSGVYQTLSREKDGHIYYALQSMYVGGLFFDKSLFEKNGWNQNPKTWDDFLKLCDTIKSKNMTPITFSGLYNYLGFSIWWNKAFEFAQLNGTLDSFTKVFRVGGTPKYNSPEMQETYKRLYEIGKKGYFADGLPTLTHTQSQMAVLQHKAAMVSTADWVQNEMKDSTPDGFKWGYMAIPFGKNANDTIWINNGDSSSFSIWKAKPDLNKAWAKEFLRWFYNYDCQEQIASKGGMFPVRKDFTDTDKGQSSLLDIHKSILAYLKTHKYKFENNYISSKPSVGPSASQAEKYYEQNVALIAEGKQEPVAVLNKAEQLYEQGLTEGKSK